MKLHFLPFLSCRSPIITFSRLILSFLTAVCVLGDFPRAIETGPDHRVVETRSENGKVTGKYVELDGGSRYWTGDRWEETIERFEAVKGGMSAAKGPQEVFLTANINAPFTVDLKTRGKNHFRSRVFGIAYADSTLNRSVLIAKLKDSAAMRVPPNIVLYRDAFDGVKADVRYTYSKMGFEQDIVFREQLPTPESYGLKIGSTELQIYTEFFDPPKQKSRDEKGDRKDTQGDVLDFDDIAFGKGVAFRLENGAKAGKEHTVKKEWITVEGRTFLVEHVSFGEVKEALSKLRASTEVPPGGFRSVSAKILGELLRASTYEGVSKSLPPAKVLAELPKEDAFVVDYVMVTSIANRTFQGDTTYYVSGPITLSGNITFEAGAVIKYAANVGAKITCQSGSTVQWIGSPFRPVIFTAKDDNTVGETIGGSNGNPANNYYAVEALRFETTTIPEISNLRVSFAQQAIIVNSLAPLRIVNAQFVKCDNALKSVIGAPIFVGNGLFYNVRTAFNDVGTAIVDGQHLSFNNITLSGASYIASGNNSIGSVGLINSVIGGVTAFSANAYPSQIGSFNAFLTCPGFGSAQTILSATPFQIVGAGACYLEANSALRNAGTQAIDEALARNLALGTTYPPVFAPASYTAGAPPYPIWAPLAARDTDKPDLGYHYDPIDYLCSQLSLPSVSQNYLTLTNGVAVGFFGAYGIKLVEVTGVVSEGRPDAMNHLFWYQAVQEQPSKINNQTTSVYSSIFNTEMATSTSSGIPKPKMWLRFTDLPNLGSRMSLVYNIPYPRNFYQIYLQDCAIRGQNITTGASYEWFPPNSMPNVQILNCVLDRSTVYLYNGYADYYVWDGSFTRVDNPLAVTIYNNLFWRSTLSLLYRDAFANYHPIHTIKDNVFDNASIGISGDGNYQTLIQRSHNGFLVTTPSSLGGTDARVLTSLTYDVGPLGRWYISASSAPQLKDLGSRTASAAGLSHYSIEALGVKETSLVDVGFHYVATDSGIPVDSDGDGMADFAEDRNGNGIFDAGDGGDLALAGNDSDFDGLPDPWEIQYFGNISAQNGQSDPDADGVDNLRELSMARSPSQPNVAAPLFNPPGDYNFSPVSVTVSCPTPSVTIRYTLDGSDPTTSSPSVASGSAITISQTTMLKARAWRTGWITSDIQGEKYSFDPDYQNYSPFVSITPVSGSAFLSSENIPINIFAVNDNGASIAKIQLYLGGNKIAETVNPSLDYVFERPAGGTYVFSARCIDSSGSVGVATATYTVGSGLALKVGLKAETPFVRRSPVPLSGSILGVYPGGVTAMSLNGVSLTPRSGEFVLIANLNEGLNLLTLSATDNLGRTAQATTTVYLDSAAPVLTITAPSPGAQLNTYSVDVIGNYTEAAIKEIRVNDILATVDTSTFRARAVPLEEGGNVLVAVAEDFSGNKSTNIVIVTAVVGGGGTLVDGVKFSANKAAGFAPLAVTFQAVINGIGAVQQVLYDFNGDSVVDLTRTDLNPVSYTYPAAAEVTPRVTVITSTGQYSNGELTVNSESIGSILIRGVPQQIRSMPISNPVDVKCDPSGNLYVLSGTASTFYKYDPNGTLISSKGGLGTSPKGLDVDKFGNVYVAVSGANQVFKYKFVSGSWALDTAFNLTGKIGRNDGAAGSAIGEFSGPSDVAVLPGGDRVAVSDSGNHRIQIFAQNGSWIRSWGGNGAALGQLNNPKGLFYDVGNWLFVTDSGNHRVSFGPDSGPRDTSGSFGTAVGQFQSPLGLDLGKRALYVADTGQNRIQSFSIPGRGPLQRFSPLEPRWTLSTELGLIAPASVAASENFTEERVYIADTGNNRVLLVSIPTVAPDSVWTSMKGRLIANDIAGALGYFAMARRDQYREIFYTLGTAELAQMATSLSPIVPIVIDDRMAQYRFNETINGVASTFVIDFVMEDGAWKILGF